MTDEDSVTVTPNVIQGPWKKGRKVVETDANKLEQLQEDILFGDDLTQSLMIQMIHQMGENGLDVNSRGFIQSMGFGIEVIRAIVYKEFNLEHPMIHLMESLTDVTLQSDGQLASQLNEERLDVVYDVVSWELDDDPKIS
jgi:hypothetical protein